MPTEIDEAPAALKPAKTEPNVPWKGKVRSPRYLRHPKNPFKPDASYGVAFDILASRPAGMNKDELVRLLAKATGKPEKLARYDAVIVLSARDSATGLRHRSCKDGFYVHRENNFVQLIIPEN